MKFWLLLMVPILLLSSFQSNGIDILGIGELVEHARFHKETYEDDFMSFLSKHYGEDSEAHRENPDHGKEEHEDLPFNHIVTSNTGLWLTVSMDTFCVTCCVPFTSPIWIEKSQLFYNSYIKELLDPPKGI